PEAELEVREALLHASPAILSAPDHLPALLADRLSEPARPSTAELAGRLRSAVPSPRFRLLGRTLAGRADGLIVTVPNGGRALRAVAMLPGNERFVTVAEDGVLRIHELDTGRMIDEAPASGALSGACALPAGRDVATIARGTGDQPDVLELYDVQEQVLRPLGRSEGAGLSAVCALADGTLITGDEDGVLTHWDRGYAAPLRRWRAPEDQSHSSIGQPRRTIETVLALPGGNRVATLAAGHWLSVWNVHRTELEWCAEIDGLQALASADGSLLAVTVGGQVTFRDPDTGAVQREV